MRDDSRLLHSTAHKKAQTCPGEISQLRVHIWEPNKKLGRERCCLDLLDDTVKVKFLGQGDFCTESATYHSNHLPNWVP